MNSSQQIYQVKKEFSKIQDYSMLVKAKLSLTVVLTSVLGFLIASEGNIDLIKLFLLAIGGFLVTASANAINEVLEKDFDSLMVRTSSRPLAVGRMKISEAVLFAGISCLIGISILALFNPITALMGMLSFIIYAFIYTPLKRYTTAAVAIGAIPGALPVLIGCTSVEGEISILAICLFALQFLWQFPHFWSIGYLSFGEYQKAGYKLLPVNQSSQEIDTKLGLHAFMYILLMVPISVFIFWAGFVSGIGLALLLCTVIFYGYFAWQFHRSFDRLAARKLMFSSFFFMPIVLLICLFS